MLVEDIGTRETRGHVMASFGWPIILCLRTASINYIPNRYILVALRQYDFKEIVLGDAFRSTVNEPSAFFQ